MRSIPWMAAVLALGGCATGGQQSGVQTAAIAPQQIQRVTYATTPCHGFCPVYSVTIQADGAGTFTGTSNTAVIGERRFEATPAQVSDFFARLRPHLPVGEVLLDGPERCTSYASDLPSVDISWTGGRAPGHLRFDYGCDRDRHRVLAEALRAAPEALPIAAMIGAR